MKNPGDCACFPSPGEEGRGEGERFLESHFRSGRLLAFNRGSVNLRVHNARSNVPTRFVPLSPDLLAGREEIRAWLRRFADTIPTCRDDSALLPVRWRRPERTASLAELFWRGA